MKRKLKKAIVCALIFMFGVFILEHYELLVDIVSINKVSTVFTMSHYHQEFQVSNENQPKVFNSVLLKENERSKHNSMDDHVVHRYALSSSYWEQQTNAIINLYNFQRWAASVGLTVVEPFVNQSKLQFPGEIFYGHHNTSLNVLHFHDYVDIKYYNRRAHVLGDVPALEPWERFVQYTGKKLIVIIVAYHIPPSGIYINDEIKTSQHPLCNTEMSSFYNKHSKLIHNLQFEVVRNVCISIFKYGNIMSPKQFDTVLDIDSYPNDITLWVSEWRGIGVSRITFTGLQKGELYRLHGGKDLLLTLIHPSRRILLDSKKYVKQVLNCEFNQYCAVVVRARPFRNMSVEQNLMFFNKCAAELMEYLSELRTNQSKTFLSISLGRFGDNDAWFFDKEVGDYFDHNSNGHYTGNAQKLFQQFLNIVYENKTIDSYDNDFVRVTNGLTDSGYVATIQKTVATNARNLVVVGGRSSFQRAIIVNYKENNNNNIKHICYSEFD